MKRFTASKAVPGVAIGATLLTGAVTFSTIATGVARADNATQAASAQPGDNGVWVRPTMKGAQSAGWVRQPGAAAQRASTQRQESVAAFRVETDAAGKQWVMVHPSLKGAQGAGLVRVPVQEAK